MYAVQEKGLFSKLVVALMLVSLNHLSILGQEPYKHTDLMKQGFCLFQLVMFNLASEESLISVSGAGYNLHHADIL